MKDMVIRTLIFMAVLIVAGFFAIMTDDQRLTVFQQKIVVTSTLIILSAVLFAVLYPRKETALYYSAVEMLDAQKSILKRSQKDVSEIFFQHIFVKLKNELKNDPDALVDLGATSNSLEALESFAKKILTKEYCLISQEIVDEIKESRQVLEWDIENVTSSYKDIGEFFVKADTIQQAMKNVDLLWKKTQKEKEEVEA